jgi:hypothetical protein
MKGIKSPSFWICILIPLFAFFYSGSEMSYKKTDRFFGWDVICYYNYLPTFLKYHSSNVGVCAKPGYIETEDKVKIGKTSMGMAFLYLPSYLLAWLFISITGLPNGEYSTPYAFALQIGCVVYLLLGLFALRRVLRIYFNDVVVMLGLAGIYFGSNMVYYTVWEGAMSHIYMFSLISIQLLLAVCWFDKPDTRTTIAIGLITGLISLARPTSVVVLIVLFFFRVRNGAQFKERMEFLWKQRVKLLLAVAFAILIWIPQIIYWHALTGHFLMLGYPGERFFFDQPLVHYLLFSYRSGWLMYNPLFIFAIAGFFFMHKYAKDFVIGIPLYFLLTIYILSSWWCWWWVGVGTRSMIETYPLMAIAFCSLLAWLLSLKLFIKILVFPLLLFIAFIGYFFSWQYSRTLIHYDGMTKKMYWRTFFKTEQPYYYWRDVKSPDYEAAKRGQRLNN